MNTDSTANGMTMERTPLPDPLPTSWGEGIRKIKIRIKIRNGGAP